MGKRSIDYAAQGNHYNRSYLTGPPLKSTALKLYAYSRYLPPCRLLSRLDRDEACRRHCLKEVPRASYAGATEPCNARVTTRREGVLNYREHAKKRRFYALQVVGTPPRQNVDVNQSLRRH